MEDKPWVGATWGAGKMENEKWAGATWRVGKTSRAAGWSYLARGEDGGRVMDWSYLGSGEDRGITVGWSYLGSRENKPSCRLEPLGEKGGWKASSNFRPFELLDKHPGHKAKATVIVQIHSYP